MFDRLTSNLEVHAKALVLRAERQRLIASNIANADTPGYAARDFDFKKALQDATGSTRSELGNGARLRLDTRGAVTNPGHMTLTRARQDDAKLAYAIQSQPAMDSNSVDLDRERANFVDNSVRYESTLRFISGGAKTILSAIQGQ